MMILKPDPVSTEKDLITNILQKIPLDNLSNDLSKIRSKSKTKKYLGNSTQDIPVEIFYPASSNKNFEIKEISNDAQQLNKETKPDTKPLIKKNLKGASILDRLMEKKMPLKTESNDQMSDTNDMKFPTVSLENKPRTPPTDLVKSSNDNKINYNNPFKNKSNNQERVQTVYKLSKEWDRLNSSTEELQSVHSSMVYNKDLLFQIDSNHHNHNLPESGPLNDFFAPHMKTDEKASNQDRFNKKSNPQPPNGKGKQSNEIRKPALVSVKIKMDGKISPYKSHSPPNALNLRVQQSKTANDVAVTPFSTMDNNRTSEEIAAAMVRSNQFTPHLKHRKVLDFQMFHSTHQNAIRIYSAVTTTVERLPIDAKINNILQLNGIVPGSAPSHNHGFDDDQTMLQVHSVAPNDTNQSINTYLNPSKSQTARKPSLTKKNDMISISPKSMKSPRNKFVMMVTDETTPRVIVKKIVPQPNSHNLSTQNEVSSVSSFSVMTAMTSEYEDSYVETESVKVKSPRQLVNITLPQSPRDFRFVHNDVISSTNSIIEESSVKSVGYMNSNGSVTHSTPQSYTVLNNQLRADVVNTIASVFGQDDQFTVNGVALKPKTVSHPTENRNRVKRRDDVNNLDNSDKEWINPPGILKDESLSPDNSFILIEGDDFEAADSIIFIDKPSTTSELKAISTKIDQQLLTQVAICASIEAIQTENRIFPLSPRETISKFRSAMTSYELIEINHYPTIYYVGELTNKIIPDDSNSHLIEYSINRSIAPTTYPVTDTEIQSIFDNAQGDYFAHVGDHLAYRYQLLDLLGKGSFGTVFKVHDHKLGIDLAIKIISSKKKFTEHAKKELKLLQLIGSTLEAVSMSPLQIQNQSKIAQYNPNLSISESISNNSMNSSIHYDSEDPDDPQNKKTSTSMASKCIIQLLDYFEFRNHFCFVFPLYGHNLYDFLKTNQFIGVSMGFVKKVAIQLLHCLIHLQNYGIMHCDIKPENIVIRDERTASIVLIDFGSGCHVNETSYSYIQSRFYRAPEVLIGAKYGLPIDMWSFACLLPELRTGYPAFPGESSSDQLATIAKVLGQPPETFYDHCDINKKKDLFNSMKKLLMLPSPTTHKTREIGSRSFEGLINARYQDAEFLSFLRECLQWLPERRLTPSEALKHSWIQKKPNGSKQVHSNRNENFTSRSI